MNHDPDNTGHKDEGSQRADRGTTTATPGAAGWRSEIWERLKKHKVIQWALAYLAVALAIAHGVELLAGAYLWPEGVVRLCMGLLVIGFPLAITFAWYQGHQRLSQIGAGEM